MFGFEECFCWDKVSVTEYYYPLEPKPYSLPSPLPNWPDGQGFATGRINIGELEVAQVTEFTSIWSCTPQYGETDGGVTFYKPLRIPDGFFSFGHYCQPDDQPLRGYVLVARDVAAKQSGDCCIDNESVSSSQFPALRKPLNYTLVWSSKSLQGGCGYVWMPNPTEGYKAMGFVVTNEPDEPELEEVRCVRADLTESCEASDIILDTFSTSSQYPFQVWSTRPCKRGMLATGVYVGTFFCSSTYDINSGDDLEIACLKNFDSTLHAMPNLDQIHALISFYGPTLFFHPDEAYLPSSVRWFFKNGALLYRSGESKGEAIDMRGSNLPKGGENDGDFWLDLPDYSNDERNYVKGGNIESAELYVHVKPASGGSFTDISMWFFCPFNGPATIKARWFNFEMSRVGEHVSDWEHFTLRLSNFNGELWSVYFSEHSGGEWLDACNLEFIDGNKPIVYASKNGHASFPHPGCYLQGYSKLGIGIRNDVAQSKYSVDSSTKYQIVAAEYLGDFVTEPDWLQFMREWGPTIEYDARSDIEKIIKRLPFFLRFSAEILFDLFPNELYGEEGPTGPKEKDNWLGDERC